MAASEKTKALEVAYNKAMKNYSSVKDSRPKPTWSMNQNDKSIDDAINRLIRQSPAGSAQRQQYMDAKAAYKTKLDDWKTKFDQAENAFKASLEAYQASAKLDPLLKKQQDNKDTGVVDTKTDTQVDALKVKVDAAPAADGSTSKPELRYAPDGSSLVPGTEAYKKGSTVKPTTLTAPAPAPAPKPKPKPGDGAVTPPPPAADGLDTKTLWVSYLRSTFASLEDKTQKAQIDKLLDDAKTYTYSEKVFMDALKGTLWWQTTLPSMRQFFLDTHDKRNASTFTEKVQNKMSTIAAKLDTLGISAMSTDPATGKLIDNSEFIKGLAMQTIQNNWDDAQLEDFIATKSTVMFTGGGTLGSTLEKVKNQAYMYGIKIDSALEKEINFSLLDPNDGRDANYWLYSVKQQAMDSPTYKPFAESLKAGRSLYEVTNNYRQQMANLLEVDSTAITWDDLMGKVVDNTTGNARTFADFTKQVKQDKLWQYTKNAKETYSNMALDLARTFGFSG
jgi:hypothetical protein